MLDVKRDVKKKCTYDMVFVADVACASVEMALADPIHTKLRKIALFQP